MSLDEIIRRLYASEIDVALETQWDAGIRVRLEGKAEHTFDIEEIDAIPLWLDEQARKHFPGSDYARDA